MSSFSPCVQLRGVPVPQYPDYAWEIVPVAYRGRHGGKTNVVKKSSLQSKDREPDSMPDWSSTYLQSEFSSCRLLRYCKRQQHQWRAADSAFHLECATKCANLDGFPSKLDDEPCRQLRYRLRHERLIRCQHAGQQHHGYKPPDGGHRFGNRDTLSFSSSID